MKRLVLTVVCALSLAACVSPATYGPAASARGSGYTEQRIEADRFRVSFHGAGPSAQIQDYALLRASELTLQSGFDWFRVVNRFEDSRYGSGSSLSVGTGGANYGRHSGVGVGIGTSFDLSGGPTRTITLEILMGQGPAPREPDAYDARSVADSVRARIGGGPPPR